MLFALSSFVDWCSVSGISGLANGGALRLAAVEGAGLGFVAARDVVAGEEVLSVPVDCALVASGSSVPWQLSLAQRLEVLPVGVQGFPHSQRAALQYRPAIEALERIDAERRSLVATVEGADADALEEALSLVVTRAFLLPLGSDGGPWAETVGRRWSLPRRNTGYCARGPAC